MFSFIVVFGAVVFFVVDFIGEGKAIAFYATIAFVIGSITSMICGWIGMAIAV